MKSSADNTVKKGGYRLAEASSPYLRSHAENPVEWYQWGEDAFKKAVDEDKPVFLSVGYSSCHWCHVMAQESFSDPEIASILNTHFVSIKVDREERPDVDSIYMQAVQAMTGGGGWPLSVFLTPDKQPFYGGTYFPPRDAGGHAGFDRVLLALVEAWNNRREELITSAGRFTNLLISQLANTPAKTDLSDQMLDMAFKELHTNFDRKNGGFNAAPKFPQPGNLSFLLIYWYRTGNQDALSMVGQTLNKMAQGGIYDQLGGGFHRYATDAKWQIPHYEKMLYDQALLAKIYLQFYQITGEQFYADAARETLDYLIRDMQSPQGGFYSAEDADSEGVEGKFYLWTREEVADVLDGKTADIVCDYFGISDQPSTLSISGDVSEVAPRHEISEADYEKLIYSAKKKLFQARKTRTRPARDEKVITAWNGLAISAFAAGGRVLGNENYLDAARRAAIYLLDDLAEGTQLRRHSFEGAKIGRGTLEDYAFLARGLLDINLADISPEWQDRTVELIEEMLDKFQAQDGSFYLTDEQSDSPLMRFKPDYDGALPSGNSIAAEVLLRAACLADRQDFMDRAEQLLKAFSGRFETVPTSLADMLTGLDYRLGPVSSIRIAPGEQGPEVTEMLDAVNERFLPRTWWKVESEVETKDNSTTAYICIGKACREPVTDMEVFRKAIDELAGKEPENA
ncbi:Thioredoxin-related protein [Anaerohalosphaera lusitana]|uniref:Thioredoxin-related protein n=1 Tax=Anaerohalosphaera lusitana TaxID=1936003 RepID=A0A1U9NNS1_9BACT|nr:thioredoxin domain-containing protein [Anaerohalosphaera lusitana]AQT69485.1 Thioredoxin-related protein [Anaerohalosphaera lusitana]